MVSSQKKIDLSVTEIKDVPDMKIVKTNIPALRCELFPADQIKPALAQKTICSKIINNDTSKVNGQISQRKSLQGTSKVVKSANKLAIAAIDIEEKNEEKKPIIEPESRNVPDAT